MTQTQQRPRSREYLPHDVNYQRQAQQDFAWYSRMSPRELDFVLNVGQASRRGRRNGEAKRKILQLAREYPSMTVKEIAQQAGVVYDYASRVLRGTR